MRCKKWIWIGLSVTAFAIPLVGYDGKISELLENSPFGGGARPIIANKIEPKGILELRGVVVENGVTWFTLYNAITKKWTTARQGETTGSFTIREYNKMNGTLVVDAQGVTITLAYNAVSTGDVVRRISAPAMLAAELKPTVQISLVPQVSTAESKRLEQVAGFIRQRIEQARLATAQSNSARS